MRRFVFNLLLFLSPILMLLGIYVVKDPFKVLYHYDAYYHTNVHEYVTLDKDYISTQTFINNYPGHHYDSYIFGNSNSMYYHTSEWQKHIHSQACYHFDASGETLYGVEKKLRFLKKKNVIIKNALFCTSSSLLSAVANQRGTILTKHPALSGEKWLDFQGEFLRDFFDASFLYAYLDFFFTGHIKSYMIKKELMSNDIFSYDASDNELTFPEYEVQIEKNKDSFYIPRMHFFGKRGREQRYSLPVIGPEQKKLLLSIKEILDADKSDYRFVINPLYDQVKLDTTDLQFLKNTFGADNVFDFSGINGITQNMYNYYDNIHYRPFIANSIMDSIYNNEKVQ